MTQTVCYCKLTLIVWSHGVLFFSISLIIIQIIFSLILRLNVTKCQIMTFSRRQNNYSFVYIFHDTPIAHAESSIRNLVILDSIFLEMRIEKMHCKTFKFLGFVIRVIRWFKLSISFKIIFCALVRPLLEYGSMLQAPHTPSHACMIKRVQKKFLRFTSHSLHIRYDFFGLSNLSFIWKLKYTNGIQLLQIN